MKGIVELFRPPLVNTADSSQSLLHQQKVRGALATYINLSDVYPEEVTDSFKDKELLTLWYHQKTTILDLNLLNPLLVCIYYSQNLNDPNEETIWALFGKYTKRWGMTQYTFVQSHGCSQVIV